MLPFIVVLATSFAAYAATAPKPTTAGDAAVEATIRAKFAKSKINEERFTVTVKNGVALIEGKTSIPQRKGVATRLAKTGGAREVLNKIEVSESARKQMTDRLQKARTQKTTAPAKVPAAPASKPATAVAAPETPAATAAAQPAEPTPLRRMQIKR